MGAESKLPVLGWRFVGPPIVISLYKRTSCNEISKISKMPKVKKHRKSNRLNGKRGGRPKTKEISDSSDNNETDNNDSDEDYFYGTQPRRVDNSNSMCFMQMKMLQTTIDAASKCDCGSPNYKVDISSYQGFNCNVQLTCKCGNTKRIWAAPENFDKACLAACKLTGIKKGQIQDLLLCLNFGYQRDEDHSNTINVYKPRLVKISQELDVELDQMKQADEKFFLEQILSSSETKVVAVETDGMYPISNNSGICVSSIMGTVNGEKKIIGNNQKYGI